MKNKLIDLNDHLFSQIERLGDEDLSAEELQKEIARAKAISMVSSQIVSNSALALSAAKFKKEHGSNTELPEMIEGKTYA